MAELDPRIILSGTPVDIPGGFARGLQIRDMRNRMRSGEQMDALRIQQAQQQNRQMISQAEREREYLEARRGLALIDRANTPEMWDMIARQAAPNLVGRFQDRDVIRAILETTLDALDPRTVDEPKTMKGPGGSIIQLIPDGRGGFEVKTLVEGQEDAPSGYRRTPSGDLTFVPGGPADPAVREAQRGPGSSVVLPDGTRIDLFGGTDPGFGKKAEGELDEKLLNSAELLTDLRQIEEAFDPRFLQIPDRLGVAWANAKDKFGSASEAQKQEITEFSIFRRRVLDTLTKRLSALSGAAVTPQEFERISQTLPNAGTGIFDGDGPTEFKAKMDDAIRAMRLAIMRYNIWRARGGVGGPEEVAQIASLDNPETIVAMRWEMLQAEAQQQGLTDQAEIDALVEAQIRREIGN